MKNNTVHTSRTLMFDELSRVVENGKHNHSYFESIDDNAIGKKSKSNLLKTRNHLSKLYDFDESEPQFKLFIEYWNICSQEEQRILALLMALKNDHLLRQSIEVVMSVGLGSKVKIEYLQEPISATQTYSERTLISTSQNLASSWKQAGFILGKVKNIRVKPNITYRVVAFAIILGIHDGLSGQFLLDTPYVRALGLGADELKTKLHEAQMRDLIKYQNAGGVVSFSLVNSK